MDKKYSPRYQQIAADVAAKIANKHYKIGEKIYARSSLASQYGVSAETARRAISILTAHEIVKTTHGSGIIISSLENAVIFLNTYQDIKSVNFLKDEIVGIVDKISEDNSILKKRILEMIDKTEKFKSINPFTPFETTVEESALHLGKSLSELNFWQKTKATVIGIKHNDTLILSPGPSAILLEKDVLYYVGDENCPTRVHDFLYK